MKGVARAKFEVDETAVTIVADQQFISQAVEGILHARADIERQIADDPFFLTTFEPYDRGQAANETTRRMCEASEAVGIGPMACVAGAVAQAGLEAMVANGCRHGWVDNGGDIALIVEEPTTIEVFSGSAPGTRDAIAFEMEALGKVMGVCSSSGKLGHSISLGESDVSVAIADSAVLADAMATAMGNAVQRGRGLETAFAAVSGVNGFIGGLVMLDGAVGITGDMPDIVETEHNLHRMTAHSRMSSIAYGDGGDNQKPRRMRD